jgi:hypothetical protein
VLVQLMLVLEKLAETPDKPVDSVSFERIANCSQLSGLIRPGGPWATLQRQDPQQQLATLTAEATPAPGLWKK